MSLHWSSLLYFQQVKLQKTACALSNPSYEKMTLIYTSSLLVFDVFPLCILYEVQAADTALISGT